MFSISIPEGDSVRASGQQDTLDPPEPPPARSPRFDGDEERNTFDALSSTRKTHASIGGDHDLSLKSPWRRTLEVFGCIVGAFALLSIIAAVALSTLSINVLNTADNFIVLVGSTFSVVASCALLRTAFYMCSKDFETFSLVISATSADLLQALFYFIVSISGLLGDSSATAGVRCTISCFCAQFVWFAVNCWGFSLAANAFFTYMCPISYGSISKKYLGWYHLWCWGLAFVTACVGTYIDTPEMYAIDSYCWVSNAYRTTLYDLPTLTMTAIEVAFIIYISTQILEHPGKRMPRANLNALSTLIWITRVTIAFLAANVWYLPLDFGAPPSAAWTAVVGDLFASFQGFINFVLWFPKISQTLSKRRETKAIRKAEAGLGFEGRNDRFYIRKHKMGFFSENKRKSRSISNSFSLLEVKRTTNQTCNTPGTDNVTPFEVDEERAPREV